MHLILIDCFIALFGNGQVHNIASMLSNVVKLDVENGDVVSTLSNVVQY